ncbi:MAG TPA: hypothetical protein PKK33_03525 [Candidatus Cloacimonadota bacterium]|nr:hypothetical protein [Candidatus Cloacimonadota bacterium]
MRYEVHTSYQIADKFNHEGCMNSISLAMKIPIESQTKTNAIPIPFQSREIGMRLERDWYPIGKGLEW